MSAFKLRMSNCFAVNTFLLLVRGHRINLAFISIFILLTLVQRFLLNRANEQKKQEKAKLSEEELQQIAENDSRVGDESIEYEYRL